MALPRKLKNLLKSNPATIGLINYLESLESRINGSSDNVELVDVPTKTSYLVNDSGYITSEDIADKVDKSEIFQDGVFTTINTNSNGSVTKIWNEPDGGGTQIVDGQTNVQAYTGVHEGSDGTDIYVQTYAVDKNSKEGTRININKNGAFYTKNKTNYKFSSDDEIVTKAMLMEEINILKARIDALEN